ncbi:MAG: hypothetical protein GY768_32215, partial [Planctomycetaceae bacterium]|nr:hypothetical protein [Planctomycetaceae bacterium]
MASAPDDELRPEYQNLVSRKTTLKPLDRRRGIEEVLQKESTDMQSALEQKGITSSTSMLTLDAISERTKESEKEDFEYAREGRTKDYWVRLPGQVVRVHVKHRQALFTPANSRCPVPPSKLSQKRVTRYCRLDGPWQKRVDVWTGDDTAHMNLGFRWIGETTFEIDRDAASDPGDCPSPV